MAYKFYGWQVATQQAIHPLYRGIETPQDLYDALTHVWSRETCSPALRPRWSESNKTLGQCSITAWLVQDIFGGEVYGILLPTGGVHCYNVVDGAVFDLTSEQFGDEVLCYEGNPLQTREAHLGDEGKNSRYHLLCEGLEAYCAR